MNQTVFTSTLNGRELAVETWSSNGPFIKASSGRHYCPPEGCGRCARGESHDYHHGLPIQGFTDDQGRWWGRGEVSREDGSENYGWWETTFRWWLQHERPHGSCPQCGGDGEPLERGFTCTCGFRGQPEKVWIGTESGGWGNGPYRTRLVVSAEKPTDEVLSRASSWQEDDVTLTWRLADAEDLATPARRVMLAGARANANK